MNNNHEITPLEPTEFPAAAEVIRASFSTVAEEFGLTPQNCPTHTSFAVSTERLQAQHYRGWQMFGLYDEGRLAGYAAISDEGGGTFELHNLAVLPEYRHRCHGSLLLNFCKSKAKAAGGGKIVLSIIEENTRLKNWYAANGFLHTGTKRFNQFPFTVGFMEGDLQLWDSK